MKIVFVTVQMLFMCGSLVMALTKNKFAVLFLSITPGMLDATIYNIPYTLVANYHSSGMVSEFKIKIRLSSSPVKNEMLLCS